MARWVFLVIGLALLVAMPGRAELFSDELDADAYDCALVLQPAAKVRATSAVRLTLEAGVTGEETRLAINTSALLIDTVRKGVATRKGRLNLALKPGASLNVTILRRGARIGILRDGALVYQVDAPRAAGHEARITADKGWTIEEARVQRLEPVVFADNFMRTADEPGAWSVQRGEWGIKSAWDRDARNSRRRFELIEFAQNPFAWIGRATQGSALCVAGQPFWEDYTLTAAICPPEDGAIGAVVNMTGPDSGLLVRWTSATERGPGGDTLTLCRLQGEQETVLAESRGGYIPGQWYRLSVVTSIDGVRVSIDGRERLTAKDAALWRGGVGLYARGAEGAVFDDVTVYGRTLATDLIAEHRLARFNERFKEDAKGMAHWATAQGDWQPFPGISAFRQHRWDFYGDHWLTLPVTPTDLPTGRICLLLNGDGKSDVTGYRAEIARVEGAKALTCTLYRNAETLAQTTLDPLEAGEEYTVRFARTGNQLTLQLDGETLLTKTDPHPLTGLRPAYVADGCFGNTGEVLALGSHLLDYSFSDAPVDWQGEGTWMPTNRWSCSSQWSFLGGWGHGDTALWHKARFTGDQTFEAFLAVKMEYPRERQTYEERFRDMAITICGDGQDPRSGYAAIYGAADEQGNPNRRSVLLRNGKVVGTATNIMPTSGPGHTAWFPLMLQKRGDTVEFWLDGARIISYTDPAPLAGGVPAIWTQNNGVMVARARLAYAQLPTPRTEPQVTIDEPWYPLWGNVGRPLALDFPRAFSTTGQPVQLQAKIAEAPEGEALPTVAARRVTITPQKTGKHWYQVTAQDGALRSPTFHAALPVFNPALGRDDSHALVLYRFDEAQGATVRDHGLGEPADLHFPADAPVSWMPGQGLTIHGPGRVMTSGGVPKLMALGEKKTATIEMWVAQDTCFPPTDWVAGMVAWELPNDQRNFALAQLRWDLSVVPGGATLNPAWRSAARWRIISTGLQHLTVTWDGTTTRIYVDGEKRREFRQNWNPTLWKADAPLILGMLADGQPNYHRAYESYYRLGANILPNSPEMQNCYLGTFFLVAIHDRCFTDAEIARHYQAGPAAK